VNPDFIYSCECFKLYRTCRDCQKKPRPGNRACVSISILYYPHPKVSLADIKALNGWRDVIPEYVKDYVSLNQFAA